MWQMHVQFLIFKCEVQDNFDWILIFLLEDVEYDHLSNASVIAMFVSSLWQDVYCPFGVFQLWTFWNSHPALLCLHHATFSNTNVLSRVSYSLSG